MGVVGQVLTIVLMCFLILLIFRLVMEYVRQFARSWEPARPMKIVLETVYSITDPPLKLLRRVLPAPQIGGMRLDLSFFVLMIIVWILISAVGYLR